MPTPNQTYGHFLNGSLCHSCGLGCSTEEMLTGPNNQTYCPTCFVREFHACHRCGCVTRRGYNHCQACWDDTQGISQARSVPTVGLTTPTPTLAPAPAPAPVCGICGRAGGLIEGTDRYSYCHSCFNSRFRHCNDCGELMRRCGNSCCENCRYDDDNDDDDDNDSCEFDAQRFRGRAEYTKTYSSRNYGVEIETHSCDNHMELANQVPFCAKYDGSISGKEFASAVLYGDAGLEAIKNLCDFAADNHWTVNRGCGLHIHLDVQNLTTDELRAIAAAYYMTKGVWSVLVRSDRVTNSYCHEHRCNLHDIMQFDSFQAFSEDQARYEWCNFAAYAKFRTIEIRSHQGSLNAAEICNWIRLHLIFMAWAQEHTFAEVKRTLWCIDGAEQFDFIMGLCVAAGASDLVEYYSNKAIGYGHQEAINVDRYAPAIA